MNDITSRHRSWKLIFFLQTLEAATKVEDSGEEPLAAQLESSCVSRNAVDHDCMAVQISAYRCDCWSSTQFLPQHTVHACCQNQRYVLLPLGDGFRHREEKGDAHHDLRTVSPTGFDDWRSGYHSGTSGAMGGMDPSHFVVQQLALP